MRKASHIKLFNLLFVVVVALPSLFWLLGKETFFENTEKRKLAAFPTWSWSLDSIEKFPKKFEAYYGDHFGLRTEMVKVNNYAKREWLKVSGVRKVVIGKQNWLFFAGEKAIEDYRAEHPFTPEELQVIEQNLRYHQEQLSQKGIPFVVVIVPNKHTIYPEYLPNYIVKTNNPSRADQVVNILSNTSVQYIDLRAPLQQHKSKTQLYYRTDTHWNDIGGYIGYVQVMQHLMRVGIQPRVVMAEHLTVEQADLTGDLVRALSLNEFDSEPFIRCEPTLDKERVENTFKHLGNTGNHNLFKVNNEALPKLLMFHDSFGQTIRKYSSYGFKESVFVWNHRINHKLIEEYQPDVVVLEVVERYLPALLKDTPPK